MKPLLITFLSLILIGCGGQTAKPGKLSDDASSQTLPDNFLTKEDLTKPAGITELSPLELKNLINEDSTYLLTKPDEESPLGDCFPLPKKHMTPRAYKDGYEVRINLDSDQPCTVGSDKVTKRDIKLVGKRTCEGVDFSKLTADTLHQVAAMCEPAPLTTGFSQAKLHGEVEGDEPFYVSRVEASMSSSGKPCRKVNANGRVERGDCVYFTKSTIQSLDKSDLPHVRYLKQQYIGLKGTQGDRYYSEGQFKLEIGNWTGVMTYTAGDEAPTYVMRRGSDEVRGTFEFGREIQPWDDEADFDGDVEEPGNFIEDTGSFDDDDED